LRSNFAALDPTGNDFCFVQNYLDDEVEGLYALLHDEAPSDSVFLLANRLLQTGTEPAILVSLALLDGLLSAPNFSELEFLDDFHCAVASALSFDSPAVAENLQRCFDRTLQRSWG
jgi:hypothetical protein